MRTKSLSIINSIFLTISICSCSSYYRSPESFKDKMSRFKPNQTANSIPSIPVVNAAVSKARKPASKDNSSTQYNYSNKRLYFLTLLNQYSTIGQFTKDKPPILNSCPHFHSSMVDHKEKFNSTDIYKKINNSFLENISLDSSESVAKYPVLALPVTKENNHPQAIDLMKENKVDSRSKILSNAINIHLVKTYQELTELCEYGTSDNYYSYINLMNSIKVNSFPATDENMGVLLKTSLISNYALQESLKKISIKKTDRSPASSVNSPKYEQEIFNRMNINWANNYVTNTIGR
jgi:hypothetical protein